MDPWDVNNLGNSDSETINLHQLLSSKNDKCGLGCVSSKRVVNPAVPFMTVKEERKCLSEIRNRCSNGIPENFVLSNGMNAEDFALLYVLGHQVKRRQKMDKSESHEKFKKDGNNNTFTKRSKNSD